MMNVSPLSGLDAARAVDPALRAVPAAEDGFQAMFARVAQAARDSLHVGEAAAIAGVAGDTSVQNVVRAMMSAEQQLKAAIAVRDRVVAAYQEVSRMQI